MKFKILIILLLFCKTVAAQNNCPPGYQMRKVKCNGKMEYRCVPDNYACQSCWVVAFAPCPNSNSGGQNSYDTYERALNRAQNESSSWSENHTKCIWYDSEKYEIYLEDSKQCNASSNAQGQFIFDDLVKRIKPIYMRMNAEIDNYKRQLAGKSYKPGAVLDEYKDNLKLA